MERSITVHQALFGYDAGHHLLSESVSLSAELKHFLSIASDLSGSSPSSGFDRTYTGMPIPGTDYYVLFCTWLATEMPRPGCVWSHALLIELADLADIRDLGSLRPLFRRPLKSDKLRTYYQQPLVLLPKPNSETVVPESETLSMLLSAVYGMPSQPIVIFGGSAEEFEDAIFAIWSQQWPRLRRRFQFSTGSFADRSGPGVPFDLQVSPESNRRAWQQSNCFFVDPKSVVFANQSSLTPKVIQKVIHDLLKPGQSDFRSFLRDYGADVASPRKAFGPLATVYIESKPFTKQWTEILRLIANVFPEPSDALRLKEWATFPGEWRNKLDAGVLLETTRFLLSAKESQAFEQVPSHANQTVPILWKQKRSEILALITHLVRRQETRAANEFVCAVAQVVRADDLQEIWSDSPELVSLFVNFSPSIAFNVSVWRLPEMVQWQIFDVLHRGALSPAEWGHIVGAMLRAGTHVGIREAVAKAGNFAIDSALSSLTLLVAEEQLPTQLWRETLSRLATDRFYKSSDLEPVELAFCIWLMPHDSLRAVVATDCRVQKLLQLSLDILPKPLKPLIAFFLTSIGLRSDGAEGLPLLNKGFFVTYESLEASFHPPEPWFLLASILPEAKPWDTWDRCIILIRGLREWLQRNPKEGADFVKENILRYPRIVDRIIDPPSNCAD